MNKEIVRAWIAVLLLFSSPVFSSEESERVQIIDPYIELHTGPGSGFPIFFVAKRGEWIDILIRRTTWFKVRIPEGKEGWVDRSQLEDTLTAAGEVTRFKDVGLGDFSQRRWEMALSGGQYDGATLVSFSTGFMLTSHLTGEIALSQAIGNFSTNWLADVNLLAQPFPRWRFSLFITIGVGAVRTEPKATIVQTADRSDAQAHSGVGIRGYMTRRFVFRVEYGSYVVFSSDDNNEDPEAWKIGFSVFF